MPMISYLKNVLHGCFGGMVSGWWGHLPFTILKHRFLYMFDYYTFLIGKFGNFRLSFVMLSCYINLERVGFVYWFWNKVVLSQILCDEIFPVDSQRENQVNTMLRIQYNFGVKSLW